MVGVRDEACQCYALVHVQAHVAAAKELAGVGGSEVPEEDCQMMEGEEPTVRCVHVCVCA